MYCLYIYKITIYISPLIIPIPVIDLKANTHKQRYLKNMNVIDVLFIYL